MRKLFKSYQTPTAEEFKDIWERCLFVLDANVLLSLYRYSQSTKDELLGILKNYKDRIWIPHQVGLEFSRNRVKVILDQTLTYDQLTKEIDVIVKGYCGTLDAKCSRHPFIDAQALKKQFSESMEVIKKDISNKKQNHPDLMSSDKTLESINELFENNIGEAYQEEELRKIYKDAEDRYKEKIPPGYEDSRKDDHRKYGDYIVWRQILDKATKDKRPVILITDERKEDWWLNVNGKTISPRPELIEEMLKVAGVDFYMYQSDTFVKYAAKLLKDPIAEQTIDKVILEIQDLRSDEENKEIENENLVVKALREHYLNNNKRSYYDWFVKDIKSTDGGLLNWKGKQDEIERNLIELDQLKRIEENEKLYKDISDINQFIELLKIEEFKNKIKKNK